MKLYHVMPEIVAFFLLAVLYIYHLCEKDLYRARQQKLLSAVMIISMINVAVNIVSCLFIITEASFSYLIIYAMHGMCFLLSIIQASLLLLYVVNMTYNVSPHSYRARWFILAAETLPVINIAALIINIPTGLIFTVDPVTFEYVRGPLTILTSVSIMIEIVLSQAVLLMERKYQTPEFTRLSEVCPPIVAILLILQTVMTDMQLSGLISFTVQLFMLFNLATNHLLEDEVTGFPNRVCFENSLRDSFSRGHSFAVTRLRISSLEGLRRTFGTMETDVIIKDIAQRLVSLGGLKHIFRCGDNEFMLIAPGMDTKECSLFAEELIRVFESDWYMGDSVIRLETEVLMISCPVVAEDYGTVMAILDYTSGNAPETLRITAENGNRTHDVSLLICDVKTKSLINREHYVLSRLRKACATNGFEYYYQPIYKVTGEFSGIAECLLRLRDEDHNVFISPYEFIPIAEKYGLIGIIGDYVLDASCALVRRFIDAGMTPPILSVNFSARQFYDVTLPANVMKCINAHGIPSSCIKIEITESYLITNFDQVRQMMDELVSQGVGFYLDDFGSGFSNIPRYINLPFECIKYDHSLLKSSETNEKTDRLLRAMTPSFISFGYKIVFEGVEKEDNLSYVSSFGDVYVQGYYFSYAVPEKRFMAMLGLDS